MALAGPAEAAIAVPTASAQAVGAADLWEVGAPGGFWAAAAELLALLQAAMAVSERVAAEASQVAPICITSVELAAQHHQAIPRAAGAAVGLGELFSFTKGAFSPSKTTSIFLATLTILGPAARQRQEMLMDFLEPLLEKRSLSGREAASSSRSTTP